MNFHGTHTIVEDGIGTGPALVMVHGVGLDLHMWDLIAPSLLSAPRGPCQVLRFDLLGHGKTRAAGGCISINDFVGQLDHVISALDSDQPPNVAGLSLGGAIVRTAAINQTTRMGRLVLANTVFARSSQQRAGNVDRLRIAEKEGMEPIADLAIARWFTDAWCAQHPDRAEAIHHRIATTDLEGYLAAYRAFIYDDPLEVDCLPSVQNEALVVTGSRDTGSTPAMTNDMAAALCNGSAIVMNDIGHLPPIEDPKTFSSLLLDFLE